MDPSDQALAMLQGIWNEMKTLNGRVNTTNERLDGLTARVDHLTARVEWGFARVDARFDQLLIGEHGHEHRDFRERIARLEQHAGLPSTGR